MGMKNCCPVLMILGGLGTFFWSFVLTFGFKSIVKIAVPIAVGFLKSNASIDAWLEVPVSLALTATLTNAFTSPSPMNGSLAVGTLGFKLEMEQLSPDEDEAFAIVWAEEGVEMDVVSPYLFLLSDGEINYAKYVAFAFAGSSFFFAGFLAIIWLTMFGGGDDKSSPDD